MFLISEQFGTICIDPRVQIVLYPFCFAVYNLMDFHVRQFYLHGFLSFRGAKKKTIWATFSINHRGDKTHGQISHKTRMAKVVFVIYVYSMWIGLTNIVCWILVIVMLLASVYVIWVLDELEICQNKFAFSKISNVVAMIQHERLKRNNTLQRWLCVLTMTPLILFMVVVTS